MYSYIAHELSKGAKSHLLKSNYFCHCHLFVCMHVCAVGILPPLPSLACNAVGILPPLPSFACMSACISCSGYSAIPYELLQVPSVVSVSTPPSTPLRSSLSSQGQHSNPDSVQPSSSKKIVKFDSDEITHISENGIKPSTPMAVDSEKDSSSSHSSSVKPDVSNKGITGMQSEQLIESSSSTHLELHSVSLSPLAMRKRSGSMAVHSLGDGSQSMVLSKSEDSKVFGSKEEEFIAGLMQPELVVLTDGKAVIRELFLPPPPTPDILHILTPTPSTISRTLNTPSKSGSSLKLSNSTTPRAITPSRSPSKSPASGKRRKTCDVGSTINLMKSKEKLLQPKREKYCPPGRYAWEI